MARAVERSSHRSFRAGYRFCNIDMVYMNMRTCDTSTGIKFCFRLRKELLALGLKYLVRLKIGEKQSRGQRALRC